MYENFSNPARENFEHAQGIEVALELKIKRQREGYEACIGKMQEQARLSRIEAGANERQIKGYIEELTTITSEQNDLFRQMEAIVPPVMIGLSIEIGSGLTIPKKKVSDDTSVWMNFTDPQIKEASETKKSSGVKIADDFPNKLVEALNALTFQETIAFSNAHLALGELLQRKNRITLELEKLEIVEPASYTANMLELDVLIDEAREAKEELDRLTSMRSARMFELVNKVGEEDRPNSDKELQAHLIAQEKMAEAYELGANDEQAFEVWESEFVSQMVEDEEIDTAAAVALFENEELNEANERADAALEYAATTKRDNEALKQKLAVMSGEVLSLANESATEVLAKEADWVDLKPHPRDSKTAKFCKILLNKLKPTGKTLEVLLEDERWDGEFDNHARRHLALRTGVVIKGNRTKVTFLEHIEVTKFRCIIDGTVCELAFKENNAKGKLAISTAFNDSENWTKELEKNTALHGVAADAADNEEYKPETLAGWHKLIATHTIS
ncbi:hypothetical protein OAP51_05875 [Alphaproteobacteria bacterium]|nr:hypothetical protein [Alphaproteobacteria bacterium]